MAKKTSKGIVAAEIGAGLAAAGAAAAASYYFYASKNAKQHRKVAAKWADNMKKEVIKEAKHLEKISEKDFAKVVDMVAATYSDVRSIKAADLKRAASELKSNWDMIQRELERTGRKDVSRAKVVGKKALSGAKKAVKKMVKKVVKKAVKKAAPKKRKSR